MYCRSGTRSSHTHFKSRDWIQGQGMDNGIFSWRTITTEYKNFVDFLGCTSNFWGEASASLVQLLHTCQAAFQGKQRVLLIIIPPYDDFCFLILEIWLPKQIHHLFYLLLLKNHLDHRGLEVRMNTLP